MAFSSSHYVLKVCLHFLLRSIHVYGKMLPNLVNLCKFCTFVPFRFFGAMHLKYLSVIFSSLQVLNGRCPLVPFFIDTFMARQL